MKWIKVTDVLTHTIPETFIRYDQGQQKVIGDHVTIRDIWENGWNDIEYLDESPSSDPAEVLVKALEWYADKDNYTADNGEFATAWRDQMDYKAVKALKTYQDEMGKGK